MPAPALLRPIYGRDIAGGATVGTIRLDVNAVSEDVSFPASGSLDLDGEYYLSGDGAADDLLAMLEAAIESHSQAPAATVSEDGAGQISIQLGGLDTFQVLGSHANTDVDLTIWGMTDGADQPSPAANNYDPPTLHEAAFFPGIDPETDTLDELSYVAGTAQALEGQPFTVVVESDNDRQERTLGWSQLDGGIVRETLASAAVEPTTFERFWNESLKYGYPFRYYPDTTDRATYQTYELAPGMDRLPWQRNTPDLVWWDIRPLPLSRVP